VKGGGVAYPAGVVGRALEALGPAAFEMSGFRLPCSFYRGTSDVFG
jgi:hypothetical protein